MANINAEINAIQSATNSNSMRTPMVGALNKLAGATLPDVSSSDSGKVLAVDANGAWSLADDVVPRPTGTKQITTNGTHDVTNYASAQVAVPSSSPTLITKSISQNGTYSAQDDNADGYSQVTVNVSGGGGIPLVTKSEWYALTIEQKKAYGLVAIQEAQPSDRFKCGILGYGANYKQARFSDMVPVHNWNASSNRTDTYNFDSTAPSGYETLFCLAVTAQNGADPISGSNLNALAAGTSGNGNYCVYYDEFSPASYAQTYSSGNNWNNSEIVCFEFSGDIFPTIKELYYEQGSDGTYTYTYTATKKENLLLICMRGGSAGNSYTVTGLTQKSHVTSSGARFSDVYFDEVNAGDEISINIPYAKGLSNNGSLLVLLLAVDAAEQ